MTPLRSKKAVLPTIVVLVALLSACSSSSKTTTAANTSSTAAGATTSGPTSTSAPTTTQPAAQTQASIVAALAKVGPATATGKTVSLAKGPKGIFLIGPNGHTLYVFTRDQGATTACTDSECKEYWPPLIATGAVTSGPGIAVAKVATADGAAAKQVTYYGHLLYYFKGDTRPGQTAGTTLPDWDLLGPFGNVMLPQS